MKLGLMQPYFFPYLPYWKLISAVDTYVIYDDVNFIKNGFINRNYILLNNCPHVFTIPLSQASPNKIIKDIELSKEPNKIKKLLKTIQSSYGRAPYFKNVYPFIEKFILTEDKYIVTPLVAHIREISSYLEMETNILLSSQLNKNNEKKGEEKVIDICKFLQADVYINAIGGKGLYSKENFAEAGIELNFISSEPFAYEQFGKSFVPNLSLIDVLMFNSKEKVIKELNNYELI